MNNDFQLKRKSLKNLLWLGIFGIIMMFSGLASAYIIRSKGGNWLHFELPDIFYVSTVTIMISSITIFLAEKNIRQNHFRLTAIFLIVTFILGTMFSVFQFLGWKALYENGIVYAGKYSNPSGSFLYLFTFLHLLHLLAGMIGLIVVIIKTFMKKYSSENYLGIELISIYWHFLDGLWIFLFLFLIYIH